MTAVSRDALLLVARGTSDRRGRDAAEAVANRVGAQLPDTQTALGFVTWNKPTVIAAAEELVEKGACTIVAVPLTTHEEALVTTALGRLLRRLARAHRNVSFRMAPSLEHLSDLTPLVERAAAAAVPVPAARVPQDDVVEEYRSARLRPVRSARHVVMCASSYCAEQGATHMLDGLRDQLDQVAEKDPSKWVKLTRSGCLSLCGAAPAMIVYPEGTWYAGFDSLQLQRIVDQHLVGGCPVAELMREPVDGPRPSPSRSSPTLQS